MTRHDLIDAYVAAFNAGQAAAVERLYEDQALLVPRPGTPVTGQARAAATDHLLGFGAPIQARPRHIYVAGDIALLVVDWAIEGTGMRLEGAAADVARRGDDGIWRYVIDNPFGTA